MTKSPAQTASTKGEKLAHRLSQILARLHQGDPVNKHDLAQHFKVDVRTIERDLNERLHGIAERGPNGYWQLSHSSRSTIPAQHLHRYARMAGTAQLFPDSSLHYLLGQLEVPEPRRATQVQATPQEDLRPQSSLFADLQKAIEQKWECRFTYKHTSRHAQPYRLIHKEGVWYLAAEEDGKLKNFSVARITALQVNENSRFAPKPAHQDYINRKEDVWFTSETTEVLLRISPEIAHYFTRRPLLPQQQHRQDTDGSLLVSTHISHVNQLLPVVRYWLPHVRILTPVAFHKQLLDELRSVLAQWELPA